MMIYQIDAHGVDLSRQYIDSVKVIGPYGINTFSHVSPTALTQLLARLGATTTESNDFFDKAKLVPWSLFLPYRTTA